MDNIIKTIPQGMRPARPDEKADWIGPHGGRYKKLGPAEKFGIVPEAKSEIQQLQTPDEETVTRMGNAQKIWLSDARNFVKSKDVDNRIKNRIVQGTSLAHIMFADYAKGELEKKGRELHLHNEGDAITGMAMTKSFPEHKTLEIEALATCPKTIVAKERKGVGTKLVYRIVKNARAAGIEKIKLKPTWDSIGFYDKLGFKEGEENGVVSLEGKNIDKFLNHFEEKDLQKAQLFAPYEFGEIDLHGAFRLEDIHGPIINGLGWKSLGGKRNVGIHPDFRMYSNIMPSASQLKISYKKVGDSGNVLTPYRRGIMYGAGEEKIVEKEAPISSIGAAPEVAMKMEDKMRKDVDPLSHINRNIGENRVVEYRLTPEEQANRFDDAFYETVGKEKKQDNPPNKTQHYNEGIIKTNNEEENVTKGVKNLPQPMKNPKKIEEIIPAKLRKLPFAKADDPRAVKQRLLGNIQHFLEKYEDVPGTKKEKEDLAVIRKSIEDIIASENDEPEIEEAREVLKQDIKVFLKGYENLAYLGNNMDDSRIWDIFKKAVSINEDRNMNLKMDGGDRIGRIISIDSVAHELHKKKNIDGTSQYKILDDLADISKSLGEKERSTRLLVMKNPDTVKEIEKMLKIEILQKSGVERSSKFWKLLEKAIKIGVKQLNNYELIALREWLYAKM
jgi:N-acetylglutamate synthase-like GNAT family acetyltransferase